MPMTTDMCIVFYLYYMDQISVQTEKSLENVFLRAYNAAHRISKSCFDKFIAANAGK